MLNLTPALDKLKKDYATVNTTWNRLNLKISRDKMDIQERAHLLLNSGLDVMGMDFACLTRLQDNRLSVMYSTDKAWEHLSVPVHEAPCYYTLKTNDIISSNSAEDWEGSRVIDALRFGSYIGLPVSTSTGTLYGTIFFASYNPRIHLFSLKEEEFLHDIVTSLQKYL